MFNRVLNAPLLATGLNIVVVYFHVFICIMSLMLANETHGVQYLMMDDPITYKYP